MRFPPAIKTKQHDRETTMPTRQSWNRRSFIAAGAAVTGVNALPRLANAQDGKTSSDGIVRPPEGKKILLSCKLGMIADKEGDRPLSVTERLRMAGDAGFDGVDFDEAGKFTLQEAREAVQQSGVFVHNAINHAHWRQRLTSPDANVRATAKANVEHCIRLSHAAGGNGVLIVIGSSVDGPEVDAVERCKEEIRSLIPLAASLGQPILFENVWNKMMYVHGGPNDQSAERFVDFVDSFRSPWVGMYYDIGNHWKYGQPGEWIRQFGHRCIKLDVKGFSRAKDNWTEIGEGDLPWDDVRKALDEIGFTGWATAEVGGGNLDRLKEISANMDKVFGLE